MLQIANHTPFPSTLTVVPNAEAIDCVVSVLKATFVTHGSDVVPTDEQLPIVVADEYWGDPETTGLKQAGELTLPKPATDVLLTGHAYAPGGAAKQSAVRVRVGPIEKTVYVYGSRVWLPGVTGFSISEPKPFQKIPLRYEYAFGGVDQVPIDENRPDYEPRNPAGQSLIPMRSHRSAKSMLLPNLEDPRNLMKSPLDRPAPACFAPIAPHWEPRKSLAGTYDETWEKERAPYLPHDFDPRFFQCAPPGLTAKPHLAGGEPVEIVGATPAAAWRFSLPTCSLQFNYRFRGDSVVQTPVLDTIVFEPDEQRFTMLWRDCLVVDKWLPQMKQLTIECAEYARQEAA